jgi:hypothetical protein
MITGIIALSAPAALPLTDLFILQAMKYIALGCLTASLPFSAHTVIFNSRALQVCLWEWIIAIPDEVKMIRLGKRRRRYFLYALYYLVR